MKNKLKSSVDISSVDILFLLLISLVLTACTIPPNPSPDANIPQIPVQLIPQDVVDKCTTPHEVYGLPPQPIPGIPVMLIRHAECLGHTNIVVAIWPGDKSKVNLLYVEMLVERYVQHLKAGNEFYTAELLALDKVTVSKEAQETSSMPAFAGVYKLKHQVDSSTKNSDKKITTE